MSSYQAETGAFGMKAAGTKVLVMPVSVAWLFVPIVHAEPVDENPGGVVFSAKGARWPTPITTDAMSAARHGSRPGSKMKPGTSLTDAVLNCGCGERPPHSPSPQGVESVDRRPAGAWQDYWRRGIATVIAAATCCLCRDHRACGD